ncbi:hypothetical protein Tco_0787530 [Tanacetum coccineum]
MFRQTLSDAVRNWFDDLDPKSVDSFEELSQKFLKEFSQHKRYAKDPTETIGHLELDKKLNDKIPKTMDDTFERVRAFIRGEVALGSAEVDIDPLWEKGESEAGAARENSEEA